MKRYDKFVYMESKLTHVRSTFDGTLSEAFATYGDSFSYFVRCRDCGNIHEFCDQCRVCGLPTKVNKKDVVTI